MLQIAVKLIGEKTKINIIFYGISIIDVTGLILVTTIVIL